MVKDTDEPNEDCDEDQNIVVLQQLGEQGQEDNEKVLKPYRDRLLKQSVPLIPMPDLTPVRGHLVHMLPHLEAITDHILTAMTPFQYVRLPPILLQVTLG